MCGWRSSPVGRGGLRAGTPWLLLGLAVLSLANGCSRRENSPAPKPTGGATLRLSQRNEPGTLDAATATLPDEFAILRALSEGLLIPGAGGRLEPGAASRFEVSADGLTYTFHLRPNGRWSNGERVTAAQFVAAYRRLLTPATAAPKANVFYPVRNARAFVTGAITDFSQVGFAAPDDLTLVVTLEQPTPGFPYYVASGPWLPVPVHLIEKHGRSWTSPSHFVGNGPFQLAEWRPDQHLAVKKNPHWHGADRVRLAEIRFVRFDSADTEDRAYRSGQIDATMTVPASKLESYARERPQEVQRAPMIETRYFSFNTRRPPLDDARVRRALSLAVDRRKIVELILKGGQAPADRFVPPALRESPAAADTRNSPVRAHDADAARSLLKAAGISAENFPKLEVTAWSPSQIPVLEAAQQMWRQELGLEVTIAIREARVHLDALSAGNYDIAFITAIPDVADTAQLLGDFVTGAPENYPHWSNAAFDRAFQRGVALADPAARAAAFLEAEQHLLDDAAVAPVYFNTKIWLMSPRVRGWQEDGLWSRSYHSVYLDEK